MATTARRTWSLNGSLEGPATSHSIEYFRRIKVQFARPLRHRLPATLIADIHRNAPVVLLLLDRRPAAILRAVVAIIVDAVKCVRRRWFTAHISQECWEVVAPAFAHRNAARPIDRIFLGFLIKTAVLSGAPRRILSAHRFAVCLGALRQQFFVQAPTAQSVTISEPFSIDDHDVIARAAAAPPRTITGRPGRHGDSLNNRQPSKDLSNEIDDLAHAATIHANGTYVPVQIGQFSWQ